MKIWGTLGGWAEYFPPVMLAVASRGVLGGGKMPPPVKSFLSAVAATLVSALLTAGATAYLTQQVMKVELEAVKREMTAQRVELRRVEDKVDVNELRSQEWIRHHLEARK